MTNNSNNHQSQPPTLLDVFLICLFSVCLFILGPSLQRQFYGKVHSSGVEVHDELSNANGFVSETDFRVVVESRPTK